MDGGSCFQWFYVGSCQGSATKDFEVGKGLKQGDHFSLFLFIIFIEGLTWLIKKVVELSLFKGFRVNEETSYIVVQFTDDTFFVREGNWDNL